MCIGKIQQLENTDKTQVGHTYIQKQELNPQPWKWESQQ